SVLAEAQSSRAPDRRLAGRCVLRRIRDGEVAVGDCARLAAAVSLVLAAAKVRDHVADGDGAVGWYGIRAAAGGLARRWARQGAETGGGPGLRTAVLADAVDRQASVEAAAGPGTPLLATTEPTETATAVAFGHTAVLAGRPGNQAALAEVGKLFGRVAHLLDAVEDLPADVASGAWNPLAATGTPVDEARPLCQDALLGIRLALAETEFADARLVHLLLGDELSRSVRRTFGHQNRAPRPQAVPGGPARRFSPRPAAARQRSRRHSAAGNRDIQPARKSGARRSSAIRAARRPAAPHTAPEPQRLAGLRRLPFLLRLV